MPWSGKSFASKHNHRLKGGSAKKAAKQANAILKKTGNEGLAIAWCFLVHDLLVGALIGGGWLYWHNFGFGFPPG